MAEDFDPVQHIHETMKKFEGLPRRSWGLRIVDEAPTQKIHETLPPSRVWKNGDPTNRKLSGTSAIGIRSSSPEHIKAALDRAKGNENNYYFGEHHLLIHGDRHHTGIDEGERVIHNAKLAAHYEANDPGHTSMPSKVVSAVGDEMT